MPSLAEQVSELKAFLPSLSPRDFAFAASLVTQFQKKGKLSPNQAPWVGKLLVQFNAPPAAPAAPVEAVEVGDFAGVVKLFAVAKEHLKFPKFNLLVGDTEVKISLAGPKSKYFGKVLVYGEGVYPQRKFYGAVTPEGAWQAGGSIDPAFREPLMSLLVDLAIDPAGAASKFGKLTGRCCFCNLHLSDPRSTAVGFGETCAQHYGLHSQWKAAAALVAASPVVSEFGEDESNATNA